LTTGADPGEFYLAPRLAQPRGGCHDLPAGP
jgi:hypothetical protein